MHITPSLNADVCLWENLMEWKRKYAFYTSCEAFINGWSKKTRVNRARKLSRDEGSLQAASPDAPTDEDT